MKSRAGKRPGSGRGAVSNRTGRFERNTVVLVDDPSTEGEIIEARRPQTKVTPEATRKALTTNDSPDVPFDRSINPYKGCEHGCVYCFARPTHAYLGLSPGLDFETRIYSKPDAPDALRRELGRPGYRPDVVALGANTDPYQPVERRERITRRLLEVLAEHEHPVSVITKSSLVLRDLDLLAPMAAKRLAHVYLSITTLDPELARRMEPRASTPSGRIAAIAELRSAGVPVGVLASPMIPALNDAELEKILEGAAAAGATSAGYVLVRLPLEVEDLFSEWLAIHYPLRAKHVLSLIRNTRGGDLYRSGYGERMRGSGAYADLLARRFDAACERLGLARRPADFDLTRFRTSAGCQLGLFDRSRARPLN